MTLYGLLNRYEKSRPCGSRADQRRNIRGTLKTLREALANEGWLLVGCHGGYLVPAHEAVLHEAEEWHRAQDCTLTDAEEAQAQEYADYLCRHPRQLFRFGSASSAWANLAHRAWLINNRIVALLPDMPDKE